MVTLPFTSVRLALTVSAVLMLLFVAFAPSSANAQCGGYYELNPYGPSGQHFSSNPNQQEMGAQLASIWRTAFGNGSDSSFVQSNQVCEGGGAPEGGGSVAFPSVAIAAVPQIIVAGNSSELGWGSTDVASCVIDQGIGSVPPNALGNRTVSPTVTTTYTITCDGISSSVTITVNGIPDLIGQVGGAATASINQPITLYGGVANQSNNATGYFPNIVQVCEQDCLVVTNPPRLNAVLPATAVTTLPANGWQQVSASYTPTTQGELFYRVCANNNSSWTNVHTESNYANNCSGWQRLTVGEPRPDLAPVSLVPTTVVAGTPATFTATLRNAGGVATPDFSSTIYICQSSDNACLSNSLARGNESPLENLFSFLAPVAHAAASIKVTLTGSAIAANSDGTQTGTQTLGSPGSYSMRLCADLPANQVTETNENDNCGTWQLLSVCPSGNTVGAGGSCVPPGTMSCSLNANPTSVAAGGSSTLTWSSTGATSCTGVGFSTGGNTSGSTSVTPTDSGSYSVTCNGGAGTCNATPVTVTVGGTCPGTPTADIQATPSRVNSGQSTAITWSATAIDGACTISGPGINQTVSAVSCNVPTATITTPTLTTQSTYTISCDGGAVSDTVIVNLIPGVIEF